MKKGESGAALITTLLISLLIFVISLTVTHIIRSKVRLTIELKDSIEAKIKAENLLERSLFILSTHPFVHDGIVWEENGKIKWWLATDSSSTTYTLGDAQSGLKYYYLTDPSNDGIENLPVSLFRVEMFWSDSVRASVKMTWFGY